MDVRFPVSDFQAKPISRFPKAEKETPCEILVKYICGECHQRHSVLIKARRVGSGFKLGRAYYADVERLVEKFLVRESIRFTTIEKILVR